MADIKAWITVNGRHIPIMEGENKATALANHFSKLRKLKISERKGEFASKFYEEGAKGRKLAKNEFKKSMSSDEDDRIIDRIDSEAGRKADAYMREKYGKNWNKGSDRTITGRAKTKEERYKEINKEYEDKVKEAEKTYMKDKYDSWGDFGAHLGAYDRARNEAFEERNRKVERERVFKTDKYKLKEDKRPIDTQIEKKVDKLDDAIRRAQGYYGGRRDEAAVRALTQKRDKLVESMGEKGTSNTSSSSDKRKISGYKNPSKVDWSSGKNKEIEVTFWRSNPQLQNGGYEMKRTYTAKTENGLMSQIRKTENATVYGGMYARSYKEKPRTYRKIESTQVQRNAYKEYIKQHPSSKMKFSTFQSKYYKD